MKNQARKMLSKYADDIAIARKEVEEELGVEFASEMVDSERAVRYAVEMLQAAGDLTPDEVAELAKAKREERVVVVPFATGSRVYEADTYRVKPKVIERRINTWVVSDGKVRYAEVGSTICLRMSDFNKRWFATRKEAEKALEEWRNER